MKNDKPIWVYLASQSVRRRQLLRQVGIPYTILPVRVDESAPPEAIPRDYAVDMARQKVITVRHRVRGGIILGADTIVVLGNQILGKPVDQNDARRMLRALSGKTHEVITGVCLLSLPDGRWLTDAATTQVKFRRLSRNEIEEYLATLEPYDKAGAYGIQGRAGLFVERIEGDYFNIVGLPLSMVYEMLKKLNR
jgi:septum formation protein